MAQRLRTAIFFFMSFEVSAFKPLLDHLIRPRQHIRWNRLADLLRCFQIDDELELCRLLDRQLGGLRAFKNFIDESRRAPKIIGDIRTVRHETAIIREFSLWKNRRKSLLIREIDNRSSVVP